MRPRPRTILALAPMVVGALWFLGMVALPGTFAYTPYGPGLMFAGLPFAGLVLGTRIDPTDVTPVDSFEFPDRDGDD